MYRLWIVANNTPLEHLWEQRLFDTVPLAVDYVVKRFGLFYRPYFQELGKSLTITGGEDGADYKTPLIEWTLWIEEVQATPVPTITFEGAAATAFINLFAAVGVYSTTECRTIADVINARNAFLKVVEESAASLMPIVDAALDKMEKPQS